MRATAALLRAPTAISIITRLMPGTPNSVIIQATKLEHPTMAKKVFMPDDPALPMNYPGFVFRTLREEGYSEDELLKETGLEEAQLSDPHFRCGFQPLRRLLLNAIQQTGDPDLGARLALKFQPTYIGLPSYAAMNAARFDDGLEVLTKFFFLNFPAFEISVIHGQPGLQPGEAAIRLRSKFPFGDIEYFGISSAIVAINGLLKAMLRTDKAATRAEMTVGRPDNWPAVEAELGVVFRFEASENQIIFPEALLKRPLPGSDPLNHARLLSLCEQFVQEMEFETTPVTQVLAILETATTLTVPLRAVAAKLGYSERGLRRHLDRSGTSYRELVNQVRAKRAGALLSGTAQPIKAIAGALGFESPSNFARSFKDWTGLTPKAFRERAQTQTLTRDEPGRK
ncbi:AraC family transcriptional regulator [Falsiroseomonas selenitidurans]|nr:AraC family transcriptional regulator [Falsiroseomonas selenitidurans]